MWNQFPWIENVWNCNFDTFSKTEVRFQWISAIHQFMECAKVKIQCLSEISKMQAFEVFNSQKMILRKIWVTENWRFFDVCFSSLITISRKIWSAEFFLCENFMIFVSLRFYVKSILEILEVQICHFNLCRSSEFGFLWLFALFEGWNLPNYQNSEPL